MKTNNALKFSKVVDQSTRDRIARLWRFPVQSDLLDEVVLHLAADAEDKYRLASIIKRDLGITAKLFERAQAKGVLPMDHVALVESVSDELQAIFSDPQKHFLPLQSPMLGFSLTTMSDRALRASILAQNMAGKELPEQVDVAYWAGYLHEVGLYALCAASLTEHSQSSLQRAIFSNEQALTAGTLLLESWKSPRLLTESIACQLDPEKLEPEALTIAALLNIVCALVAAEDSPEALGALLKAEFFEKIGRKDLVDRSKLWVYSTFKQGA